MQRTSFADMACSLARALDVVGEPWTPLIVRDIWLRRTKFEEIQRNLGLSRKVLADRLETLVREQVVERRQYLEHPRRYEYVLTEKGDELMAVLLALMCWGDRWVSPEPPMLVRHPECRTTALAQVACSGCGAPLKASDLRPAPGPGARNGWGTPWGDLLGAPGRGASRAVPGSQLL